MEPAGPGRQDTRFGKRHITRRRVFCQSLSCRAARARE